MPDESLFDQALLEVGDRNGVLSSRDLFEGWRVYRNQYGDNPDVIRLTEGTLMDMYTDSVLRDIIVTKETVFMTPSVDPERNLELFEEKTSEDAFGMIMGMEIVIDDEFRGNEVLLYEREHGVTERSVIIRV